MKHYRTLSTKLTIWRIISLILLIGVIVLIFFVNRLLNANLELEQAAKTKESMYHALYEEYLGTYNEKNYWQEKYSEISEYIYN